MNVCAVIWDLGGVLVRTEDLGPRTALAERFGMTTRELEALVFGHEGDYRSQTGEFTANRQWEHVTARLGLPAEEAPALKEDFFAGDVLDTQLVEHIYELKGRCYSALLSNAMDDLRRHLTDVWQIDDAFHHIIISAEVGLIKPDPAIYRLTLEHIGVEPGEAVFIDDTLANIDAAREAGLHGIVFRTPQQTLEELDALLGSMPLESDHLDH